MKPAVLMFVIVNLLFGCTSHHESVERFEHVDLSRSAANIRLPTKLWEEFEDLYQPLILDTSTKEIEGVTTKSKIPTEMFPIQVRLIEKTRGVLGGKNWEFTFEKGGGTLDLRDYIKSSKGTFYFKMSHGLDLNQEKMKVVFLSNSIKRQIASEEFGAGCNKYLEISTFWNDAMKDEGIPINVTRQRHIALLGGTFFFAVSSVGKLYLSQISVKDSRHKHWRCRDI